MIQNHSVVLVLDTNILPGIIQTQDSSRIDRIFSGWIRDMCEDADPPPKGKTVTIVASSSMIDDYKTGLRRRKHSEVAKTLKIIFNKSFSDMVNIRGTDRMRIMLEKIAPIQSAESRRISDPYDRKFFDVILHAAASKKWRDRQILLATLDRKFQRDSEGALRLSGGKRIHIAHDMESLKDMFAC